MRLFGLVITTAKAAEKVHIEIGRMVIGHNENMRKITADRDSAERHIKRLLYNGVELTTLWASIRQVDHENQVRQVFERLMGGGG